MAFAVVSWWIYLCKKNFSMSVHQSILSVCPIVTKLYKSIPYPISKKALVFRIRDPLQLSLFTCLYICLCVCLSQSQGISVNIFLLFLSLRQLLNHNPAAVYLSMLTAARLRTEAAADNILTYSVSLQIQPP